MFYSFNEYEALNVSISVYINELLDVAESSQVCLLVFLS